MEQKWRLFLQKGGKIEPDLKRALLRGQLDYCMGLRGQLNYYDIYPMQIAIDREDVELFMLLLNCHPYWDYKTHSVLSDAFFKILLTHPKTDFYYVKVNTHNIFSTPFTFRLALEHGFTSLVEYSYVYGHVVQEFYKAVEIIPKIIRLYRLVWNNNRLQNNVQNRCLVFLVLSVIKPVKQKPGMKWSFENLISYCKVRPRRIQENITKTDRVRHFYRNVLQMVYCVDYERDIFDIMTRTGEESWEKCCFAYEECNYDMVDTLLKLFPSKRWK